MRGMIVGGLPHFANGGILSMLHQQEMVLPMVRAPGVEPGLDRYERPVLPLNEARARTGAGGGGRTRIPSMARWNSRTLNHAREIGGPARNRTEVCRVQTGGSRPLSYRPQIAKRQIAKRMSLLRPQPSRCWRLVLGLPRTCRVVGNRLPKTKKPLADLVSGGVVDLAIWPDLFYPGGTPPLRYGVGILPTRPCVRSANNRHWRGSRRHGLADAELDNRMTR